MKVVSPARPELLNSERYRPRSSLAAADPARPRARSRAAVCRASSWADRTPSRPALSAGQSRRGGGAVLAAQPSDGSTDPVDAGGEEDDDLVGMGGRPAAQLGRQAGREGGCRRAAHGLRVDDRHGGDGVKVDADGPRPPQQARLVGVGGEQGVDELAPRAQLGLGDRPLRGQEHRHRRGADAQQAQGLLVVLRPSARPRGRRRARSAGRPGRRARPRPSASPARVAAVVVADLHRQAGRRAPAR